MKILRIILITLLTLIVLFSTIVETVYASPTSKDSYTAGTSGSVGVGGTTDWKGQTWTASSSYTMTSFKIKLYRSANYGTAQWYITTTSGGKPTNTNLASGSVSASGWTTSTSGAWYEFTLSTPISIISGTTYGIVWTKDNNDPPWSFQWLSYPGNPYPGGYMVYYSGSSQPDSGDWNTSTSDFTFDIYGDAPSPPTVETSAATSVSYTSAILNGDITSTGGLNITRRGFQYGKTSGALNMDWHEDGDFGTGVFDSDASIDSLDDGEIYYFRAYATNSAGTSYGSELSFTTLSDKPTIITSSATGVTMDKDGVTRGTFNGNLTDLGDNTRVDVSFIYGTTPACTEGETTPEELTETGAFSNSLEFPDDWTPGQTYYYKAKAVGDTYTTPQYGSAQSITFTLPAFTTEEATYTSPGVASATLNGNISSLGVATDCYGYFEWGYTTSYGNETTPQTLNATGDFDDSISGFLRNTTIHYRAVIEIDGIVSNGSDETFIITPPELTQVLWYQPNAIISGTTLPDRGISDGAQNGTITWGTLAAGLSTSWNVGELTTITLASTNTQDNTATLNGMLSSLGSYSAADVYFQYGLNTSYGSTTPFQAKTTTGVFYADITNLQPSTTYHFRAVAVGTDIVVYGADMTFTTTGAGAPGTNPPDILTIVDAKVVSGYMVAGDQLYLVSYKCIYLDGTPNAPASDYFVIQVLNNGQVVGQWALPGWGYQPVGLYLGPNSALPYGGTYTIRIIGVEKMWPTPPIPSAVRQLNPSDWLGTNLTQLDNWAITTAQSIGSYYNTELVTYTATGTVLNSAGGALFNQNISGLSNIRPMLFSAYATRPSPTSTPSTGTSYIDTWNASTNLGPYINALLEDGATTMEMDQIAFNNFVGICLWLIIVVILLFAFRGSFMAALIGAPILVGISFAGLLVPVAIVILAVLNVALLAYALLPRGTG